MTGLRERIEAERAALLDERAIAEAATPGPWEAEPDTVWTPDDRQIVECWSMADRSADAAHIARQNPAATIARIDRELARIDADLALLDAWPVITATVSGWDVIDDNLAARYPEVTA